MLINTRSGNEAICKILEENCTRSNILCDQNFSRVATEGELLEQKIVHKKKKHLYSTEDLGKIKEFYYCQLLYLCRVECYRTQVILY